MDTHIRFDRRWTVVPARPTPAGKTIKLCPSDLQMLKCNYIQKGLLYDIDVTDGNRFRSIGDLLKSSLSESLCFFYPLAGRFSVSEEGDVGIECNDAGAEFIEATAETISIADVTDADVGFAVRKLFAADGAVNTNGQSMALLIVQMTRLNDGLFLAFTINHALVDGTALWHFINSWSELCSGNPELTHQPQLARTFQPHSQLPLRLNIPKTHYNPRTFAPPDLREKVFHFKRQTIVELKKAANAQTPSNKTDISSFQALSAHIWQAITRARRLTADEPTTFRLAINCRSRLSPPLPYGYFGNAIQIVSVTVPASEVTGQSLSDVAGVLHRIINAHREESIRAKLEGYRECPVMFTLDNSKASDNTVMMGSSPRFPMYENDFGWGRPLAVRSGWANKFDGKLSAYPAAHASGCVDVEMCLDPLTMAMLETDPLFLSEHCPY